MTEVLMFEVNVKNVTKGGGEEEDEEGTSLGLGF